MKYPTVVTIDGLAPYTRVNKEAKKLLKEFIKNQPNDGSMYTLDILLNDFIKRQKRHANRQWAGLIVCFQVYAMYQPDILVKAMEKHTNFKKSLLYHDPMISSLFLWLCLCLSETNPDMAFDGKQ
jgi:hypothetical protein